MTRQEKTIPKFPNKSTVDKPAGNEKQDKRKELSEQTVLLKGNSLFQPVSSSEYEQFLDQFFLAPSSTKEEEKKEDIHEKFYYNGSLLNAHGSACQERNVNINSGQQEHGEEKINDDGYDEEVAFYTRSHISSTTIRHCRATTTSEHRPVPFPRLSMPNFQPISDNKSRTKCSGSNHIINDHHIIVPSRPAPFKVSDHYRHSSVSTYGRDRKRLHYFDPDECSKMVFQVGTNDSQTGTSSSRSLFDGGCSLKVSASGNGITTMMDNNNDPYLTPIF